MSFRRRKILILLISLLWGCSNDVGFSVPVSSEEFSQSVAYNNKVDFLFIVDDTDSMDKVQTRLLESLVPLVSTLSRLQLDFHIASLSTTVDSKWFPMTGRFFGDPKFITLNTPDFQARLQERIILGSKGGTEERGLAAMKLALSPAYQNGEGKGFLRSDALLVIVYISDENDKSSELDADENSKDRSRVYSEFLDQLKPLWSNGQRSWIFNFIGFITKDDPCAGGGQTGYKEVGLVQMEMANKSNGKIESICQSTLSGAVENIKARLVEYLTDYKLSRAPAVDSIRVFVNGKSVPMDPVVGWIYIPEINVIRFNGTSVPKAEDDIRVEFLPAI